MKHWAGKILVPAVIVGLAAVQSFGIDAGRAASFSRSGASSTEFLREAPSSGASSTELLREASPSSGASSTEFLREAPSRSGAAASAAQDSTAIDSTATDSTLVADSIPVRKGWIWNETDSTWVLDTANLTIAGVKPRPKEETVVTVHDTLLVLLSTICTPRDTVITHRDTIHTLTDTTKYFSDRSIIKIREAVATNRDTTYATRDEVIQLYDTTYTTKDTLVTITDTIYTTRDTLVTIIDTLTTHTPTLTGIIANANADTLATPTITSRDTTITIQTPQITQRDTAVTLQVPHITSRDTTVTRTEPNIYTRDYITVLHDTIPSVLFACDTLVVPDSLRETDPFQYRYYIAIKDRPTHDEVRDSILAAGDTLELQLFDSLYVKDSTEVADAAFLVWYNSMSKKERKRYDYKQAYPAMLAEVNAKLAHKDSIKFIRDSIAEATPRILETYVLPDSMFYKRMISWKHDPDFNDIHPQTIDTSYNYHFQEQRPFKEDVNAVSLGIPGSAARLYDFSMEEESRNVIFYTPYRFYTYTPETLPMYNTKVPYTELAYWGTLFANSKKEQSNIRVMTTQNISPNLNVSLEYNRNGGYGMLQDESTDNRTFVASANYLGKRYLMHAGYIFNRVKRTENGGIVDNYWIRDTTVDPKEIEVKLTDASSVIRQNTVFLDQSYRIPFNFLHKIGHGKVKARRAEAAYRDSILASGDSAAIANYLAQEAEKNALEAAADTLERDITTAFIGHSSEYSVYTRNYDDEISSSDTTARNFYNNNFYIGNTASADSLRVMRLENRVYIRLQPKNADGIVSKIDVGVGDKLLNYYHYSPMLYMTGKSNDHFNNIYLYGGVRGQYKNYFTWDASGDYTFVGREINDFGIQANIEFNTYPFRKARTSPLTLRAHFETSLRTPDYYQEHMYTNHYKWDNNFDKISTTKIEANLDIPYWKLYAHFGYSLLTENIYYDATGTIQQNGDAMSVLSLSLRKDFNILNFFRMENNLLFQVSSKEEVVAVPKFAVHLRYYFQFNVVRNVMQMQVGVDGRWSTKWYMPGYNPALGLFYNQRETKYGCCPYMDAFINIQWKRACIFVKLLNVNEGWPNERPDYFSAHNYINPQRQLKLGISWPFYIQPAKNTGYAAKAAAEGNKNKNSGGAGGPRKATR